MFFLACEMLFGGLPCGVLHPQKFFVWSCAWVSGLIKGL